MSSKAIQAQTENEKKAAEGAAGSDDESGAPAMNKLGAVNVQDLKYLDQQKKLSMISFLTEKIKAEKEARRQEKADRKEKRAASKKHHKKSSKKERKHRRRRSSSPDSANSSDDAAHRSKRKERR